MDLLMAIDPGKHMYGWALFRDRVLHDCGWQASYTVPRMWAAEFEDSWDKNEVQLVLEGQEVYSGYQGKKTDPNDLIDVAMANGAIMFFFGKTRDQVELVPPKRWTKGVPKNIRQKRMEKELSSQELDLVPSNHNVKDAVDLGLWYLGRR